MTAGNALQRSPSRDDFAALLEESFLQHEITEGSVVKGRVVAIEKDVAVIDIGAKTEGRVALKEFNGPGREGELAVGDEVEVYVDRIENALGEAVISRDKARREESWVKLEKAFEANERVTGAIFNQVKGGYTVDLDGAVAFLPRSQVDIRPVRDVTPLLGTPQPFQILKMDRRRGNIVVSRRTVLEESRAEQRSELVANLEEGQVIDGVVKNITEYGAFVDLGGIDGLLHVTDMAWRRVNHPSEVVTIGQTVKVKIIKINHETHRISLGIKQLLADPWEGIAQRYPVDAKLKGRVTNITDYGAFVELEPGIEGLIHVSEMSWTKKNVHPGKIVSTSQEVEVQILEVDPVKRRISLGLKQTLQNPWEAFAQQHPVGSEVEGEVKNKTEFGLFIGLDGDVDGMVHLSDLDWNRPGEQVIEEFKKGDMLRAQVLDVDVEKERISLGVKQLGGDPFTEAGDLKKGQIVTCEVVDVKDSGVDVKIVDTDLTTFIRRAELARDRGDQRPERFAAGEKFDARVIQFDRKARRVQLSIKALEMAEEKEAMAQFGSTDSGASLGEILGAAFKKARTSDDKDESQD
ncbi:MULTISPECIES: 30S ribosomal protein S1 [Methylobacterium]|jgi:small subunit ribosomal protein S1|uniref:30S ribosomal protein S1 n=2 Tax=Methylobacterium TaxID=407 RepID=A0ABV2LAX4_9HYPH|nr:MULTISPECIES: 30S ribosomal protein S1 [Methylobacterium]MCJ2044912.1 30S ribosomal protein S1 [Methylobacterium sp. J-078]GJD72720.1 30S ribosomal protein S1 [Methylobacterium goesingense]